MKHLTEMKPGETLHLRSGRDLELESVTPVTCGVMLTFNVTERKEAAENATHALRHRRTCFRCLVQNGWDVLSRQIPFGRNFQRNSLWHP